MTSESVIAMSTPDNDLSAKLKAERDSSTRESSNLALVPTEEAPAFIGTWDQAQPFLRDNEYIKKGYRINFSTTGKILRSLFMCHNESTNIWSHLFGVFFFLGLFICIAIWINPGDVTLGFKSSEVQDGNTSFVFNNVTNIETKREGQNSNSSYIGSLTSTISEFMSGISDAAQQKIDGAMDYLEKLPKIIKKEVFFIETNTYNTTNLLPTSKHELSRWPLFVHLSCAIACLLFSTLFHLFSAHSLKLQKFWSRLDYGGIAILVLGSTFPPIIYGFYCHSTIKYIHLFMITSACAIAFIVTMLPNADIPKYRKFRGFLFIIVGLMAGAAPFHAAIVRNPDILVQLFYVVLGGITYISGALLYVARIPERLAPGTFDYFV